MEGFPATVQTDLRYYPVDDDLEVNALGVVRKQSTGFVYTLGSYGKGYVAVTYRRNGVQRHRYVHQLVCAAFHGPRPSPSHEVNHRDGNRRNNCADNLEWVTHADNVRHAFATGLNARGSHHANSKLTERAVRRMRQLRATCGWSFKRLGLKFGVTTSVAHAAATGRSWRHVS